MLTVHGDADNSKEYRAAIQLAKIASDFYPDLDSSRGLVIDIFHSPQCYGQEPQDIDILIFFLDARPKKELFKSIENKMIQSFCLAVEVKGHSPEGVKFDGATCYVQYRGEWHNVNKQSEGQKYSVRDYIKKNARSNYVPWVSNIIWLNSVPEEYLPKIQTNILGARMAWQDLLELVAMLSGKNRDVVETFRSKYQMDELSSIFSKQLSASKIDRKRMEAITKEILDRTQQQYAEKIGEQLLVFRGRGGTGKTVRLIRMAYQLYDQFGYRVLLLTYNKALVADLKRLLALLHVRDSIGGSGISVKTIHKFVREWLLALGVISKNDGLFIENYEALKDEAMDLLKQGAINTQDMERSKADSSKELSWDILLIDESQDWPENERDLIYKLYGHKKAIIADGVDQFVRGTSRIDWRKSIPNNESQIVSLHKSLRLKASLCNVVAHIAELIEYQNWNLEPEPSAHGGKVVVVTGNGLSEKFHRRIAKSAQHDGNKPIDILLCVPPSWVLRDGENAESIVGKTYKSWGFKVWDAVDAGLRGEYPTSTEQFRIVQYDSCRGLEGWVVVCFALDEFFTYKVDRAEFSDSERGDMFFDESESALEFAKKWLMIPLTRAIDTLVLHISEEDSYVGQILKELHRSRPEEIEWLSY